MEPFFVTGAVVGTGICIVEFARWEVNRSQELSQKRSQELKFKIEQIMQNREEWKKKNEKLNFIEKFIDEIPELSYYEARQLQKKLGKIYLEWNDE